MRKATWLRSFADHFQRDQVILHRIAAQYSLFCDASTVGTAGHAVVFGTGCHRPTCVAKKNSVRSYPRFSTATGRQKGVGSSLRNRRFILISTWSWLVRLLRRTSHNMWRSIWSKYCRFLRAIGSRSTDTIHQRRRTVGQEACRVPSKWCTLLRHAREQSDLVQQ